MERQHATRGRIALRFQRPADVTAPSLAERTWYLGTRPAGLTVPVFMAPTSTTGTEWQLSSMTMVLAQSLFAWLDNEPP
jgi:hypothetical protein